MIIKNRKKKLLWSGVFALMFLLIAWDFSNVNEYAASDDYYRLDSEFDAVSSATTKVAVVPSDYSGLDSPDWRTSSLSYDQVEDMVREAIDLQGGLDWVIQKGDKVLIKPNLVGYKPSGSGEVTDVRVVKALIRIIDEHTEGEVEIVVAEGTARDKDEVTQDDGVWGICGYKALLTDGDLNGINFRLKNINQTYSELTRMELSNGGMAALHNGAYYVHNEVLEADVYITVPVLKIHDTGITNAIKNQIGLAPGAYYGYNKCVGTQYSSGLKHDDGPRQWQTEEMVDLSTIADIDFVVVDAIMCLELYKTQSSDNQVRMNTIIAGVDPVAVDHVCARLVGLNPDDIAHITLAEKVGLGTNNPDNIEVVGEPIINVMKKFKKSQAPHGIFGQSCRTWILSETNFGTDLETEHITGEATYIPQAGSDGWSEPVYFFDDKIDLGSYYNTSSVVTYAFTYFYAPKDQDAELWIGSDEAIIVYLNGVQVYSYSGNRTFSNYDLLSETEDIQIMEGENTLLVKSLHRFGAYNFTLNICEIESDRYYKGNRVEGLKFYQDNATSIDQNNPGMAKDGLRLLQNYPNPFSSYTKIAFELPVNGKVTMKLYNLSGKEVRNIVQGNYPAGKHEININRDGLAEGIYICRLVMKNKSVSRKITVK